MEMSENAFMQTLNERREEGEDKGGVRRGRR